MRNVLRLRNQDGNVIKQGDTSEIVYELIDYNNTLPDLSNMSAKVYLTNGINIVFEKTVDVQSENGKYFVKFNIDEILKANTYTLEINIGGKYVFPSDDLERLYVTASVLGNVISQSFENKLYGEILQYGIDKHLFDDLIQNNGEGVNGIDGKSAYELAVENGYQGNISEWLASLKGQDGVQGERGEKGDTGDTGAKGEKGEDGKDGSVVTISPEGYWIIDGVSTEVKAKAEELDNLDEIFAKISHTHTTDDITDFDEKIKELKSSIETQELKIVDQTDDGSNIVVKLSDESSITIPKAKDGVDGSPFTFDMFTPEQLQQLKGEKGETGLTGESGTDGKSAYDIAKEEGYEGTKEEWLASLKGEKGEAGTSDLQLNNTPFSSLDNKLSLLTQNNFVEDFSKIVTTTNDITVEIVHSPSFTFTATQPISNDKAVRVWFNKNTNDDYIIMRETEIGNYTLQPKTVALKNMEMVDNSMFNTSYAPNFYATTVGAKLKNSFYADEISFVSVCDNRGGLWQATLDKGSNNEKTMEFSTYSDTSVSAKEIKLFDSLDWQYHTLELEFKGQDPDHPVSSPRGWFYYGDSQKPEQSATLMIKKLVPVITEGTSMKSLYSYSNKDFALQVKPVDYEGEPIFVPEHNAVGSAFKTTEPQLFGDNTKLTIVTGRTYTGIKCLWLNQNVVGRVNNVDTIKINTVHSIKNGVVDINGTVETLTDTYVKTGYFGMVPFFTENVTTILTSKGKKYAPDISGTYRIENLPDNLQTQSYLFYNDKNNVLTATTYNNLVDTMRFKKNNIKGGTWIEHRNASMGKLYQQQYKEETLSKGSKDMFSVSMLTTLAPINIYKNKE